MRVQAREEVGHGTPGDTGAPLRFHGPAGHPGDVGRCAVAGPRRSSGPPCRPSSDLQLQALANERKVTELISTLYELAARKKDYPTQLELQWFVKEQVEEEASVGNIAEQLDMVGDSRAALLMLDQKLGSRSTVE